MDQTRQIIALATLGISAYTDLKERYIYIFPLIVAGIAAVSISISQYFTKAAENMLPMFVSWIASPVVVGLFIIFLVYMLDDYIGMGDAYLVSIMGFMNGVLLNIRLLCAAFLLSGIFGLVYFGIKGNKKDMRSIQLPFAPFLLIAYVGVLIVRTT